jgi:hypothetical protein
MSLEVDLSDTEPTLLPEPGDDDEFLDLGELEDTPGMMLFDNHALQRQIEDLTRKLKDRDNEIDRAVAAERDRSISRETKRNKEVADLEESLAKAQKEIDRLATELKIYKVHKATTKLELTSQAAGLERRAMRAHMAIRFLLDYISRPGYHGDGVSSNIVMKLRKAMEEEPPPSFNLTFDAGASPRDLLMEWFGLGFKDPVGTKGSPDAFYGEDEVLAGGEAPVEEETSESLLAKERESLLMKAKKAFLGSK